MAFENISVIIPAYNRADLIEETIESVLAQSVSPHQVIVVDDGSTDGTPDVVARFGHSVKLIRQKNQGAGAARNLGFQNSTGDVVHFMDSDDLSSPNTYEVQLDALNRTGADFAYGPWVKTRFEQRKVSFQKVVVQQRAVPTSLAMYKWLLRGWVTVFQPCLLSRRLIERIGPYRTDLKPTEDSEFLFRIAKAGANFVHTPETLLLYRVHPESQISTGNDCARRQDWVRYLAAVNQHLAGNGKLDPRTAVTFGFRIIDAIRGEGVERLEEAKRLSRTISRPLFSLEAITRPARRLIACVRRMKFGDNYMSALGPAPMTDGQLQLVKQMGFQPVSNHSDQRSQSLRSATCI